MPKNKIIDAGDLRKYRIEIPNIVDDLGLDPYTVRLYMHLKRVAGPVGECWQSANTIASHCKMSTGQVSKSKQILKENDLITIMQIEHEKPGKPYHVITIRDIWLHNFQKYAQTSPHDVQRSPHDVQRSQGDLKNKRIKKEPKKKESKDFLSNTPISGRERIRDVLVDILADGVMPESDFLLRPFEHGVDALVTEFRKLEGKSRLDADLTSKIIAAIRSAYRDEGNWQFNNTTSPTRAVIACIVAQRTKDRDMPDALANIPLFKAQERQENKKRGNAR